MIKFVISVTGSFGSTGIHAKRCWSVWWNCPGPSVGYLWVSISITETWLTGKFQNFKKLAQVLQIHAPVEKKQSTKKRENVYEKMIIRSFDRLPKIFGVFGRIFWKVWEISFSLLITKLFKKPDIHIKKTSRPFVRRRCFPFPIQSCSLRNFQKKVRINQFSCIFIYVKACRYCWLMKFTSRLSFREPAKNIRGQWTIPNFWR